MTRDKPTTIDEIGIWSSALQTFTPHSYATRTSSFLGCFSTSPSQSSMIRSRIQHSAASS